MNALGTLSANITYQELEELAEYLFHRDY
jgi:hypothetical protein